MQMDDMILVSIDDHMIEPPDMYEKHVPAKWLADAPKIVRIEIDRARSTPKQSCSVRRGGTRKTIGGG